jgi:hypothetical protein
LQTACFILTVFGKARESFCFLPFFDYDLFGTSKIHDDLDAAVAAAYGLQVTATDDEILTFLCKLNAERAAEERSGLIRWLRPSFQHPEATITQATMSTADIKTAAPAKGKVAGKLAWPKTLAEQAQAVRAALTAAAGPVDVATLAKNFKGTKTDRLEDILETLASLGQARALGDGRTSRFDKDIDKRHKYVSAKSAEILLPMNFGGPTRFARLRAEFAVVSRQADNQFRKFI